MAWHKSAQLISYMFVSIVFIALIGCLGDNGDDVQKHGAEIQQTSSEQNAHTSPDQPSPNSSFLQIYKINIEAGKDVFDDIVATHPDSKPMIMGLATPLPLLTVWLPEEEWNNLSKDKQVNITYYVESLIPSVRNNPYDYVDIPSSAPLYSQFINNASNLCDDCWAIGVGRLINGEQMADKIVIVGDDAWSRHEPTGRGTNASEFRK